MFKTKISGREGGGVDGVGGGGGVGCYGLIFKLYLKIASYHPIPLKFDFLFFYLVLRCETDTFCA